METIASIDDELAHSVASMTIESDDEVPSSVHKVVSDEDLLIEILVRLPIISLQLLRFVSKWWLSLIASPEFVMRRRQIPNLDPSSGLFLRGGSSDEYDFLPFDTRIPANTYRLHSPLAGTTLKILDSCNGLLLCSTNSTTVYVYNPSINNMFKMPRNYDLKVFLYLFDDYGGPKIAFDPTKSPYYRVVNAQYYTANADVIEIQIYSSQTRNWCAIDDVFYASDFINISDGIYWNDAIHWLNRRNGQILHYKLDVEHQAKTNIYTQVPLDDKVDCSYFRLLKSRGCLLSVTMFETPVPKMDVDEMSNDNSGWSRKYCVTLDEGWRSTPTNDIRDSFRVLSIILGEKEEDSFLVMFLDGKVVRYNLGSQNVSTLTNHQYSCPPASFDFIASFARV